jgi:hypothetical protein
MESGGTAPRILNVDTDGDEWAASRPDRFALLSSKEPPHSHKFYLPIPVLYTFYLYDKVHAKNFYFTTTVNTAQCKGEQHDWISRQM